MVRIVAQEAHDRGHVLHARLRGIRLPVREGRLIYAELLSYLSLEHLQRQPPAPEVVTHGFELLRQAPLVRRRQGIATATKVILSTSGSNRSLSYALRCEVGELGSPLSRFAERITQHLPLRNSLGSAVWRRP